LTWTGDVIGSTISFDTSGAPKLKFLWDASSQLNAATLLTPSPRHIVTCCTATGGPGLPFTYAALSSTAVDPRTYYASFANVPGVSNPTSPAIAETNYIAYLRGDPSKEIANGGLYRNRSSRLGDIVNSKPVTVGAPSYPYYDAYNPGYAAYKAANASRKSVVYIGANDGMLHAFDGLTGAELFAYIPSFTYGTASTAATSGLASLGNPNFTHHYLVDGTLDQFDVDFNKTTGASGAPDWHTIIIGGLGKGGKGYYAIDVTDPTSFSNETSAAGKVLWEFTDSRLGYTYGTPSVVKTNKYGWVVVFTSGYTNADGMGYFFFVNPKTGALLEVVSTPPGSGTISSPLNVGVQSEFISNAVDFTADAVYAGDLQGNVWRVDVSSTSLTAPYPPAVKIAQFGSTQPISTRPLIEVPENSSTRYLLVGTGKLLGDSDIQSGAQQAFYAIIDGYASAGQFYGSPGNPLPGNLSFPITPSQLNIITSASLLTGLSANPSSAMGWYYNLPVTAGIAERVNVDPSAAYGIVAFIGNTPNGSACSPNGTGEVYGISFATGKTVLVNTDNSTLMASQTLPVPTGGGTSGVGTDVTILGVGGNLGIYTGTSKGQTARQNAIMTNSGGVVLINWRDVPTSN
jgi:type IV pilus assembly protein PilY1